MAKKVTADLDSDDQMIVNMKAARYQEVEIAERMKAEGRTAYNPKTIGTRWARLKKALSKRQDELLDQDLTDWHDGDVSFPPDYHFLLDLKSNVSRTRFCSKQSARQPRSRTRSNKKQRIGSGVWWRRE